MRARSTLISSALGALLLLAAAAVSILAAPAAAAPPADAHVCIVASFSSRVVAERHAYDVIRANYPRTNWSLALLPGSCSARTSVQGYVTHPRRCDVLIAAGCSTPTLALSPLVPTSTAWTDASATSQELTSVARHPSFNRVIPADDVAGRAGANVAYRLGWTTVSVLCENSAYGRSLVDAFTEALHDLGGQVDVSRCWESDAEDDEIEGRVRQVLAQRTARAIFIAGGNEALPVLQKLEVHKSSHILMVEGCADTSLDLPGSICAVYTTVEERFAAFRAGLRARDYTPLLPEFAAAGFDDADVIRSAQSTTSFYSALGYDALQHAMHGVYTYPDANQTRFPTMAEYLRSYATEGLTGTVELTPDGNRPNAPMKVMNSYIDAVTGEAVHAVVGTADTRTLVLDNFTASASRPARWYWLNSSFSDAVASNELPSEEAAEAFPVWSIVVIVVVVLALVGAGAYAATRTDPLANCPLDDAKPFSVLFVTLANEAALNDHYTPESVAAATAAMAKMVRKAVRAAKCHEAQRINDGCFMVVAKSPDRALDCAARIVRSVNTTEDCNKHLLLQAPRAHDDAVSEVLSRSRLSGQSRSSRQSRQQRHGTSPHGPRARAQSHAGLSTTRRSVGAPSSHDRSSMSLDGAGEAPPLRVTVGVTHGFGVIDHDAEHGVLSYRGALLTSAATATDAGVPGQVVTTERLVDGLQEEGTDVPGSFDLYIDPDNNNDASASASLKNKKDKETAAGSLYTYMVPEYGIAAVTVGVTHGFGVIDHDAEHGVLSYRGALLTSAATATDAGVPGQVVTTERLVDGLQEEGTDVPGSFDLYIDPDNNNDASASASLKNKKDKETAAGSLYTYMVPEYGIAGEVADAIERARAAKARADAAGGGGGGAAIGG
eukprot:CAMPEP_0174878820 /NCGR_PEP_ID=MMETSP1114-20130205/82948_1 /TAXON_ID=312471 /ORGANISM="Neobodo designis, Strain CCAP 1951/1" /LENGTH=890 /DNA_ID=CAMNT_0016114209 /DNA_START=378 /DNA_END=3047 /DNA_ORIENTATION=+